jgi:Fe2+ or Zn2+ uptake regulation protein
MGTSTKTYTLTVEEKFILNCFEEASKDELPAMSIIGRAREAEETEGFVLKLSDELIFTCLGQLIERGLLHRIEMEPGKFCYGRGQ